jgi:hypothetical protein
MPVPPERGQRRRSLAVLLPGLLALLALWDLRQELQLLADHFTLASLIFAVRAHPLAVLVLLLQPSLWRRYRRA